MIRALIAWLAQHGSARHDCLAEQVLYRIEGREQPPGAERSLVACLLRP